MIRARRPSPISRDTPIPLKIVIVGDSGVGKTCLLSQFVKRTFLDKTRTTVIDIHTQRANVQGYPVNLQIWDTAGQEVYKSMTAGYLRGADGILVVFDICDHKSFENVESWLEYVEDNTTDPIVFLVANKMDRKSERTVTEGEVKKLAKDRKLSVLEASAKVLKQVDDMILALAKTVVLTRREKIRELQDDDDNDDARLPPRAPNTPRPSRGSGNSATENSSSEKLSSSMSSRDMSGHRRSIVWDKSVLVDIEGEEEQQSKKNKCSC